MEKIAECKIFTTLDSFNVRNPWSQHRSGFRDSKVCGSCHVFCRKKRGTKTWIGNEIMKSCLVLIQWVCNKILKKRGRSFIPYINQSVTQVVFFFQAAISQAARPRNFQPPTDPPLHWPIFRFFQIQQKIKVGWMQKSWLWEWGWYRLMLQKSQAANQPPFGCLSFPINHGENHHPWWIWWLAGFWQSINSMFVI